MEQQCGWLQSNGENLDSDECQLMIIDEEDDAELAMINTSAIAKGTKLNMSISTTTIARKSTSPIKFYIKCSSNSSSALGGSSSSLLSDKEKQRSKHNSRSTIDEQQRVRSEFKKKLRQQTRPYFYGAISTLGALVKSESSCFASKQQANNGGGGGGLGKSKLPTSSQSMVNLSLASTSTASNAASATSSASSGSISAPPLIQDVLGSLIYPDRTQPIELKRDVEKLRRDFQCKLIFYFPFSTSYYLDDFSLI
jgi:hypothetical protein